MPQTFMAGELAGIPATATRFLAHSRFLRGPGRLVAPLVLVVGFCHFIG